MATSTIRLIRNCPILPEKNFRVDDIEGYINGLLPVDYIEHTNFQYIKHGLALSIKVNLAQISIALASNLVVGRLHNFNYCRIINSDTSAPVYYFILGKYWSAENTVTLTLKMDTVNTFRENLGHFTISNRTLVNREHKDRFTKIGRHIRVEQITNIVANTEYVMNWENISLNAEATSGTSKIHVKKRAKISGDVLEEHDCFIVAYRTTGTIAIRYYVEGGSEYFYNGDRSQYALEDFYFTITFRGHKYIDWGVEEPVFDSNLRGVLIEGLLLRKIDLYSEGLNPLLYKTFEQDLLDEANQDWYLIYSNQNDPSESLVNPVECHICADDRLKYKDVTEGHVYTPTDLGENYFTLLNKYNENTTLYYKVGNDWRPIALTKRFNMSMYKDGDNIKVIYALQTTGNKFSSSTTLVNTYECSQVRIVGGKVLHRTSSTPLNQYISTIEATATPVDITNDTETEGNSINDIDRTDAKLIKIIKLPYCPSRYADKSLGSGEWYFDLEKNMPKLADLNSKFEHSLTFSQNPFINLINVDIEDLTTEDLRDPYYESKLYHSDYYQPKFVYDSFGFIFQLEKVDVDDPVNYIDFKVNFVVTSTINSRFMFTFPQYKSADKQTQDYNNILPIARNNEITLYNQQFLNYLRTGYNYDVKSKQRSETASVIGTTLSAVGAIASFASSAVTGGIGIAAGISLTTTTAMSVINTANTVAQSEQNIEAKQLQLKNQSTTVGGSDDVDLMSYYTNNRAKLLIYQLSPKMKQAMFDVFHYTGYVSGEMKVPDFTSRTWFNFVSCDLQLDNVRNIPEECLQDLKERFSAGVTILHKHNGKYDWTRHYENWETALNIPDPTEV